MASKEENALSVQQRWLLELLDQKFLEQERVIQRMLDRALLESEVEDDEPISDCLARITSPTDATPQASDKASELAFEAADTEPSQATAINHKGTVSLGKKFLSERHLPDPPLKRFVQGPLDAIMGLVVCINLSFMVAMTQYQADQSSFSLNLTSPEPPATPSFFLTAEIIFFVLYVLDVTVRMYALHHHWYYDPHEGIMLMNIFDALLVIISVFELFILPSFSGADEVHTQSIRVVKLIRIVRTLRVVKTVAAFRQLRILVRTCVASIGALGWSMVLLLLMKLAFSLAMCQALQGFIQDTSADYDARKQIFDYYGSFLRALYTMFEITHSGSWPARVRPVIEKVNPWYAVPFLAYITLVVFAVIRIVTALFLKFTLDTSAHDADLAIESHSHEAQKLTKKLEALFRALDGDGDGMLSPAELVSAMSLSSVQHYFQLLEVRMADCHCLFELLDDGDGHLSITEFCQGLKQIKGQARAVDIVVLQHATSKLMKECKEIHKDLLGRRRRPSAFTITTAQV